MPIFKNQENKSFVALPPGDYQFQVTDYETGLQTGTGKTVGSPFWELKIEIEGKGATTFERLIDHPSCDWKIDCFLKCTNAVPKGTAFEFDRDAAMAAGVEWIDPIGLRGWLALIVDEYTPTGKTEKVKRNKVSVFYTDKPKLPRAASSQPVSAPESPATEEECPF